MWFNYVGGSRETEPKPPQAPHLIFHEPTALPEGMQHKPSLPAIYGEAHNQCSPLWEWRTGQNLAH